MRHLRLVLLFVLLTSLFAAEPDGWHFPVNKAIFYNYTLKQDVIWRSSGDDLGYTSTMTWTFALRATAVNGSQATVNALITHIVATLDGPAAEVRVDSRQADATSDPVYGHLVGLEGVTLTLTVDQPSGRVSAVSGGDEIVKRINARHPAAVPGDPPPFDAAAKRLYSSEALAVWWSEMLTQPASEPQAVPLAPPLTGTLRRTWTGSDFALGLSEGVSQLPVTLVDGVNAVTGTLSAVSGTGHLTMTDGVAVKATGEVRYTLNLTALTQAVEQQHHQQWTLERWTPTPEPADKTP